MISLRAKTDMPWIGVKKGDEWQVPSLLGLARHQITLGQAEVVDDKPSGKATASPVEAAPTEQSTPDSEPSESPQAEPVKRRPGRPRKKK